MRAAPLDPPPAPDLVLVGHGSRDRRAAAVLGALRDAVAAELTPTRVTLAWIEFGTPLLSDVLALGHTTRSGGQPAVVPLLLSRGAHATRDLPVHAAPPLGPDPLLTRALLDRIDEAGIALGRPLVLAATGSADPDGRADVVRQAALLQEAWGSPVRAGFVTCEPAIAVAAEEVQVAARKTAGTGPTGDLLEDDILRPAVVSFFLAPGRLPDAAEADTAHLGSHPAVVALVLARYRALLRLA